MRAHAVGNCAFVDGAIAVLEQSHPQIVEMMMQLGPLQAFDIEEDGTVVSKTGGMVTYLGKETPALVRTFGCNTYRSSSAKSATIF
eukprot:SAG31_NODE_37229_length_306_cov_0.743961_1_plen_85_part_10